MRCISPIWVRSGHRFVPCGKCNFCLSVKRQEWSFRIYQEYRRAENAFFLTLTYEDQTLPVNDESGLSELSKRDLSLFIKRLRKANKEYVNWPIRYYAVGEYGTETLRPHYHLILFNLAPAILGKLTEFWTVPRGMSEALVPAGFVYVGTCQEASIHYVTKYVINRNGDWSGREPPFAAMSKKPGIGANYLDTHSKWHKDEMRNYTKVHGQVARLPRYYRDRIFTEAERAYLATKGIEESDIAYAESVERLAEFHADPFGYRDESQWNAHEAIKSKINSNNTF